MSQRNCINILLDEYAQAGYEIHKDEIHLIHTITKLDLSYQLHNIMVTLAVIFDLPRGIKLENDSWTILTNYHKRLIDIQGELDEEFNTFSYSEYLDNGMCFTNKYTVEEFNKFRAHCARGQDIRRQFAELDTRQWAQ